ncbi:MAG: TerB family tellurite resistance protein [Ignavibacteriaceae bacterium]|nr:TerB family tellurite resistance protein [Ignavibacteriaceae bacterium]
MDIPQIDRSNYLKGLLITAKIDKQLTDAEKKIIKHFSDKLGFSSDFCEEIVNSLLANEYIKEEPIVFSDTKIAKSFIEDGLNLALADERVDEGELKWLTATANANRIDERWVNQKLNELKSSPRLFGNTEFALYSII